MGFADEALVRSAVGVLVRFAAACLGMSVVGEELAKPAVGGVLARFVARPAVLASGWLKLAKIDET